MKYDTIRKATEAWVNEFNTIPQGMIKQLMIDHPDEWEEVTVFDEDDEPDSVLPMWGWMWSFGDSCDEEWLEDNIGTMSKLGFRIYCHDEFGYWFGIDGAGYSFMDEHFIPLYKARGLHWHKEEGDE